MKNSLHRMRSAAPTLALSSLLLLAASPVVGKTWNIGGPCPPEVRKLQHQFDQALRTAKPGDPHYVPYPFPKTKQQVAADFTFYVARMIQDTALEKIPAQQRRGIEPLLAGRLRFEEMLRVAAWSLHCATMERNFYYLLRGIDPESGEEMIRFTVSDRGIAAGWTFSLDQRVSAGTVRGGHAAIRLRDPREVAQEIGKQFHLPIDRAQLVTVEGMIRCSLLVPCTAFQSKGATYIADRKSGLLYRIPPGANRLSWRNLRRGQEGRRLMGELGRTNRGLVILGGYQAVIAERVGRWAPPGW